MLHIVEALSVFSFLVLLVSPVGMERGCSARWGETQRYILVSPLPWQYACETLCASDINVTRVSIVTALETVLPLCWVKRRVLFGRVQLRGSVNKNDEQSDGSASQGSRLFLEASPYPKEASFWCQEAARPTEAEKSHIQG